MYQKESLAEIDLIYKEYGSCENGLSVEEARQRLLQYGPNIHPGKKKLGIINLFFHHLKNWFNVMLLLSAALSYLTGGFSQDPSSFQAGNALVAVMFVNIIFSMVQEYRASRVIQALHSLIPIMAKVVRDGQVAQIDGVNVVPGDLILLEEGDDVPADIRLVSAFDVTVNNSSLTGESTPQRRSTVNPNQMEADNPMDYPNIVFAGTNLLTGVAKGIVIKTGGSTQIGSIISLSRQVREPPSALQMEVDRSAKLTLFAATGIGMVFFSIALGFVGITIVNSILFAIGVMMCLVPQGLQVTLSLSMAVTAFKMAKRNVVVKRLSSVETLGAMTVLCVDKTGTMTSGEMMVEKVWEGGQTFQVTGDGYDPVGLIAQDNGKPISKTVPPLTSLFEVAAYCNNAKLLPPKEKSGRWTILGDPTDGAFLVFAEKGKFKVQQALEEHPRVHLVPFESRRRMMTSIHGSEGGSLTAYTKGASGDIIDKCTTIWMNNQIIPLSVEIKRDVQKQMDEFALQGYRVIAMANRNVPFETHEMFHHTDELHNIAVEIESEMTFLGIAALADPPRPRVREAVLEAKRAGIRVIMLTGDYEVTAEAIARRIGIISSPQPTVVSGHQLNEMDPSTLTRILEDKEPIFARILPDQKLKIVQALRSMGEVVGVTGDGVNDAPALMEANVGVAMGVGGTDVAREAADMVLVDNNFTSVVEAVKLGRAGFRNLRKFVSYVYTHNFAELGAFIAFILLRIPLPLSVVQILAIDLGMDVIPSLSLIMEPPQPNVMNQPPRKTNRLLDARILLRAAIIGTLIAIVVLLLAFNIWMDAGWMFGQQAVSNQVAHAKGMTAVMVGIMGGQIGNLFAIRTTHESAFRLSPTRNKWIFIGILSQVGIMITIVYFPFMQIVFGTAPLSLVELLILYLIAPAVLIIDELRKLIQRRIRRRPGNVLTDN